MITSSPHPSGRLGLRLFSGARALLAVSALAALAVTHQSAAQVTTPVSIALTPGGWGEVKNVANGYVVGSATAPNGERHAYVWSAATQSIRDLNPPGATGSVATGVNSRGEVTGVYVDPSVDTSGNSSPFVACYWAADGTFTSLGFRTSWYPSNRIAENGIVGGVGIDGQVYRWTPSGGLESLGHPAPGVADGSNTSIVELNARGDMIGNAGPGDVGYPFAFVAFASENAIRVLVSPGDSTPRGVYHAYNTNIQLNGINDSGVVVGTYWDFRYILYWGVGYTHNSYAFKWTSDGVFTNLGRFGSYRVPGLNDPEYFASAIAINNAGTIVGKSSTSDGSSVPFTYDSATGQMAVLAGAGNDFDPRAISDSGIVAGSSGYSNYASVLIGGVKTNIIPVFARNYNGELGRPFMKGSTFASYGYPDDYSAQRAWAVGLPSAPPPPQPPTAPVVASAPVLSVPANITVNATSGAGAQVTFTATATSTESMEIFRRSTATAEPWKSYTKTFTSGVTGSFTLGFNVISAAGGDNSVFIDAVKVVSGANTLLADGFETPNISPSSGVYADQGDVTIPVTLGSNWTFTNYGGILEGPGAPNWGSIANGTPPEGSQRAVIRDVIKKQTKMKSTNPISLVAGQVYTVSFQQASREIFGGELTYTVTLEREVSVPVTATPASGSQFVIGTTPVSLSATNSAGTTTGSFTVTVTGTPPEITASSPLNFEATGPSGASPTISATATDFNGASLPVTVSPAGPYALGITQVNLSATDSNGLTTTKQIVVNVVDTTAPTITAPASITREATGVLTPVSFTASATDLVDGSVSVTPSKASGSGFPVGVTTVTLTATDARGNTATKAFTVTITDTTAPTITTPANITREATGVLTPVSFTASATDLVDGSVTVTASKASGSGFPVGVTTVTLTATDARGNTATRTFTVTITDKTAPTITSVTPSSATLWPPNHQMVGITVNAVASDLVGVTSLKIISVTSSEPDNGLGDGDTAGDIQITGNLSVNLRAERAGNGPGRIYTITVEAKDAAGNASTKTCTVSVPKSQGGK